MTNGKEVGKSLMRI